MSKFGEIRGKRNAKYSEIAEFFNIPFAQAPTGELRFKEPVPVTEWTNGTLDGTKYGKTCMTRGNTDPETAVSLILFELIYFDPNITNQCHAERRLLASQYLDTN